jgi:hypothetical protein
MALFTDAEIITLENLLPFEGSLVQVASAHGINIDTKISLATNAVSEKLLQLLRDTGMSDPQWLSRRVIGLSTVVVTPPLERWLCFESLTKVFAEAYNVQLNTRFQRKWKEYQGESQFAADQTIQAGLGIVFTPLPKPQMPEVSVQQGRAPAESLFVQTSWVNLKGSESALSPINGLVLSNQSTITVQMAEGALAAPAAALGWNVYVGSEANQITLQNGNPLVIGSTWTLPVSGIVNGAEGGNGQSPQFLVPISRQIRRG